MKKYTMHLVLFVICFGGMVFAQTDPVGTWQGKLAVGQDKIAIQFIISKKADGSYAAVVNSPDNGAIKNVPATKVAFKDNKLTFEAASLSGSYSGTLDTKGVITGEWRQQGSVIPLVLTKYKQPELSSLKPLLGEWFGKATIRPDLIYTLVFRFEIGKDGKFAGFLDSPDQGASGIPMSDINLDGKQVSLKIPSAYVEFNGTLGTNAISGSIKQLGQEYKIDLAKGKYKVPEAQIDIPPEAMKQLLGRWTGKLATLTVEFRFERNAAGKFAILAEIKEQKTTVSATKASMTENNLSANILGGEFSGKVNGNKIEGELKGGGRSIPLFLTKEEK